MCGIIASWNFDKKIVSEITKKLSIRGRDGYGYFAMYKETEEIDKKMINPEKFVGLKQNPIIYLANSRAVPTTEYETGAGFELRNQQPFENERYVVVHNGIIANDKELIQNFDLEPSANVDSSILPELFLRVGVVTGLKLIKGSFAILCWDKIDEKLYAAKNFMPLQYQIKGEQCLFVSLSEMIPSNIVTRELPPYTCIEIDTRNIKVNSYSLWPRKENKRVMVICSGGIDSVTTAYLYKYLGYDVTLIHFLYGQAAEEVEKYAVENISKDLGCELVIYDAKKVFEPYKDVSLLLHQKKADKSVRMLDAESTLSYVPNRNATFAMIAAGIAEMLKCDTIAFGGQQMDSVYPDNNPTFMYAVDELLKYSLNWGTNIKFTAPLIHLIKHEIVALGKRIGVDYDKVCSCYYPKLVDGKIVHCLECGCCQFRTAALKIVQERQIIDDVDDFINKYVKEYI